MEKYRLKLSGIDTYLEKYGSLKLSNKKITSRASAIFEPQRLTFDIFYFDNPQSEQDNLCNIIKGRVVEYSENLNTYSKYGLSMDVIELYFGDALIFSGYISTFDSKANVTDKIINVVCYDRLIIFDILKKAQIKIADDVWTWSNFLTELNNKIIDAGFLNYSLSNNVNINDYNILDDTKYSVSLNQAWYPDLNYSDYYTGQGFYVASNGDIYYLFRQLYSSGLYISHEFIIIRLNGANLYMCEHYYRYYEQADMALTIEEIIYNESSIWGTSTKENFGDYDQINFENLPQSVLINNTIINIDELDFGGETVSLNYSGNQSMTIMYVGKRIENHEIIDTDKTDAIDILKSFMLINDWACYCSGTQIVFKLFESFSSSVTIEDDNIISIISNKNMSSSVPALSALDGDYSVLIEILSSYYSTTNQRIIYKIKILKIGNQPKAGDRITNDTYGVSAIIINKQDNWENNYITVEAIEL